MAAIFIGLIGSIVFAFLGFNAYLQAVEWLQPSGRVFITVNGNKVYLERPNVIVTPMPTSSVRSGADRVPAEPRADQQPDALGSNALGSNVAPSPEIESDDSASQPVAAAAPLPPVWIKIEKVDVDYPVVVASNAHLPKQSMVGWYYGSALPGTAGNSVFLGHVDGRAATFGHLHELEVGDEIRVLTTSAEHVYVVDWAEEVDPSEVAVIGPSDEAVVTLITCSGNWLPDERSYDKRLVVRAHYAARYDRDGSKPST